MSRSRRLKTNRFELPANEALMKQEGDTPLRPILTFHGGDGRKAHTMFLQRRHRCCEANAASRFIPETLFPPTIHCQPISVRETSSRIVSELRHTLFKKLSSRYLRLEWRICIYKIVWSFNEFFFSSSSTLISQKSKPTRWGLLWLAEQVQHVLIPTTGKQDPLKCYHSVSAYSMDTKR